MIRPVIGTIITRVAVMLMNIGVIMIAGHELGARGLGDISLVVLAITFIMLLSNVVGGSAIVYLLPRHPLSDLLYPSYAWALFTAVIALVVVHLFPLAPTGTQFHVVGLALMQSIYTIHFSVLLARQRIRAINVLQIIQAVLLLAAFAIFTQGSDHPDLMDYIHATYISFGATMLGTLLAISLLHFEPRNGHGPVLMKMIKQGGLIQVSNLLQLLNYRLAYYFIERFNGLAALGIFSVGNQLAESAWLGPKSIGSVLYARVSNSDDLQAAQRITITAAKAAFVMALMVLIVVILVPDTIYQVLFGDDIIGITRLALLLSPGILAMAISQALSHYFSGTARNIHNAVGSGIGVLVTITLGYWLIPTYGTSGAAVTASAAYTSSVIYQLLVFLRSCDAATSARWITLSDLSEAFRTLKRPD